MNKLDLFKRLEYEKIFYMVQITILAVVALFIGVRCNSLSGYCVGGISALFLIYTYANLIIRHNDTGYPTLTPLSIVIFSIAYCKMLSDVLAPYNTIALEVGLASTVISIMFVLKNTQMMSFYLVNLMGEEPREHQKVLSGKNLISLIVNLLAVVLFEYATGNIHYLVMLAIPYLLVLVQSNEFFDRVKSYSIIFNISTVMIVLTFVSGYNMALLLNVLFCSIPFTVNVVANVKEFCRRQDLKA